MATHNISKHYEVLFSSSVRPTKSCLMLKIESFSKTDILLETHCEYGLYYARDNFKTDEDHPMTTTAVNTFSRNEKSYARWHARLGQISSRKYKNIASVRGSIFLQQRHQEAQLLSLPDG